MLATLISTVAGTFITSLNLYDRVNDKRKQRKLDKGQNKKIKDLEARLTEAEKAGQDRHHRSSRGDDRDSRGRDHHDDRDHDLRGSLEAGAPMVKREYDQRLAQLGPQFAQGDCESLTPFSPPLHISSQSIVSPSFNPLLFRHNQHP